MKRPTSRKDYITTVMGISLIGMMIFRLVMGKLVGDKGMACFGSANEIYFIVAGTFSFGLSEAVSVLVRYRVRREQYKSAQRVLGGALLLGGLAGAFLGLFILVLSKKVAGGILHMPIAGLAVSMMAPSIFFFILTGIFRGYFQGNGSRVPAMHSQVLQVIFTYAGGIAGAFMYREYGQKVSALLRNEDYTSAYGAKGACIGILAASILCFLHVLVIYFVFRRNIRNQLGREMQKNQDSRLYIFRMILGTGGIYALYWFFFHASVLAGEIVLFQFSKETAGLIGKWGAYYGKALAITGIAGEIVCMACLAPVRRIAVLWEREEYRAAREKVAVLIHQCAAIAIPTAVLLAVLSENLLNVIFGGDNHQTAVWIQTGSITIVFFVLSTVFTDMLLKGKRISYAVGIGASAFVLHIGVMILLVNTGWDIPALIVGSIAFYMVITGCGFWIIMRKLQYNQEWIRTFAVTIVASAITGVIAMLLNKVFEPLLGALVSLLICVMVSVLVYLVLLTFMRAFRDDEMDEMAGGFLFRKLAEVFHIG